MLKHVEKTPDWMSAPAVDRIYSVSGCISRDFIDYIPFWKHNGWWMFDTPSIPRNLAVEQGVDLAALEMFYFEIFENEYDEIGKNWRPFQPEDSFPTNVVTPSKSVFHGYDVVSYYVGTAPECSPLSCNSLANTACVNRLCLFDDFQAAMEFAQRVTHEPGPYRIIAVYTV
jgi:hypothetical protein